MTTAEEGAAVKSRGVRGNPYSLLERTRELSNGCLMWMGSFDSDGYGRIKVNKRWVRAHREVYRRLRGEPGHKHVHHDCENRACVNIDHLSLLEPREHTQLTVRTREGSTTVKLPFHTRFAEEAQIGLGLA